VNLTANANQYNSQTVTTTSVTQQAALSTSAGLSVNWTLFDGFAARGAKLYALANKRVYEQQQRMLSAQILDQVESTAKLIGFASQYSEMAEYTKNGAAMALERITDEFKRGSVTEDSVTTAKSQLYSQEAAVALARIDLVGRWCDLVSLVGADPVLNQIPARYVQ